MITILLYKKNIKRDIVNNNLNNIFQQLLRAKQHIARSRSILSDNIDNIDDNLKQKDDLPHGTARNQGHLFSLPFGQKSKLSKPNILF